MIGYEVRTVSPIYIFAENRTYKEAKYVGEFYPGLVRRLNNTFSVLVFSTSFRSFLISIDLT